MVEPPGPTKLGGLTPTFDPSEAMPPTSSMPMTCTPAERVAGWLLRGLGDKRLVKLIRKQSPLFMRSTIGRGRLLDRNRTLPATIPFNESIATTSCLSA